MASNPWSSPAINCIANVPSKHLQQQLHVDYVVVQRRRVAVASLSESSPFADERSSAAASSEAEITADTTPKREKESQLVGITDNLDFFAARSEQDAQLLEDARIATQLGEKMNREQYGALRRKIGGTYQDFFKDSIDVDGEYVEEGWVDKSCRFCKKDTDSEPRSVDRFGRYAHVACLEKSKPGNFLSRLFGK